MNSHFLCARPLRQLVCVAVTFGVVFLAGCGLGAPDNSFTPAQSTVGAAAGGKIFGGPNPVIGAEVQLYATGCGSGTSNGVTCTQDGYGVGNMLQEAVQQGASAHQDTDSGGNFTFAGGYTCPANQYAYIVAYGGNPGAGTNNNIVLMAALGPCASINSSTHVIINELTTIAAAYALGHFTTVSGSVASHTLNVGVGAPVTNNSTYMANGVSTGCVANSFYTTALCPQTMSAGLYHAFLNASNLVNVESSTSANFFVNNPGTSVHPGQVPAQLINTLANALVTCVNTTGSENNPPGTINANACSEIYAATTLKGVAPTNTLQAMINLAAAPTLNGPGSGGASLAQIIEYTSPVASVYSPSLTSAPSSDYSIAIYYPKGLGAVTAYPFQGLVYPYSSGIDINDNIYVGNQNTGSSTKGNLVSFSSTGELLSYTADSTTYKAYYGVSPDALGNVYSGNYGTSTANAIQRYTTSNGLIGSTPTNIYATYYPAWLAVDRQNNVWFSNNQTSGAKLYEFVAGTTPTNTATDTVSILNPETVGAPASSYPIGVAVDPDQNIWLADFDSTPGSISPAVTVMANIGTPASPSYCTSTATGCFTTAGIGAAGANTYSVAFPASGSSYTAWVTNNTIGSAAENLLTPTFAANGTTVTGATVGTDVSDSASADSYQRSQADGDGNVVANDYGGSHVVVTWTAAGTYATGPASPLNTFLNPCVFSSTTTTTCTYTLSGPRDVNIDSTGSIWVSGGTAGSMLEIIGSAAPTVPLMSLGVAGRP